MFAKAFRRMRSAVLFLMQIMLFTTACARTPLETKTPEWYEVDSVFREYWLYYGGLDTLGPAISVAVQEDGKTVQTLSTCKVIFDPQAPPALKFQLAPLGKLMGMEEPPAPPPEGQDRFYVEGHYIFPDFWPLYESLGKQMVGRPLTEVRYNLIRKRYEQFFENLGFYRLEGDTQVRLLSYGAWVCGRNCKQIPDNQGATIDIQYFIAPVFKDFVKQVGADFSGFALTEPYISPDGRQEQILENVVIYSDSPSDPNAVRLLPVTEKIGILVEIPRPPSGDPNMHFFTTDGELGYDIPLFFWEYIQKRGGIDIFGNPISHYGPLDQMSFHQCFKNLCLAYDFRSNEEARIRPEPLGYAYKVLYFKNGTGGVPSSTPIPPLFEKALPTLASNEIVLYIWARFPVVDSTMNQEVGIDISNGNFPLEGLEPELYLAFLNSLQLSYPMPRTDHQGRSTFILAPIQASNGTIAIYKICLQLQDGPKVCVKDSFMIWNNP